MPDWASGITFPALEPRHGIRESLISSGIRQIDCPACWESRQRFDAPNEGRPRVQKNGGNVAVRGAVHG